jgi:hypothetical protein
MHSLLIPNPNPSQHALLALLLPLPKRLPITILKPPMLRITNPALLTPPMRATGIRTILDDFVFPCFVAVFNGRLQAALRAEILVYEKDKS